MVATVDYLFERHNNSVNDSSLGQQNPQNSQRWQDYLAYHPNQDQELVQFFLKGLVQGFRIGFNDSKTHSTQLERTFKALPYIQR